MYTHAHLQVPTFDIKKQRMTGRNPCFPWDVQRVSEKEHVEELREWGCLCATGLR